MSTIYKIAEQAGVSPVTVSRVLRGKMKGNYPKAAAKAQRILEIARSMNYRPNAAARAIQRQSTRQIGVLLHNRAEMQRRFANMAAFEMVLGINQTLAQSDYVACLVHVDMTRQGGEQSRIFRERMLDGIIVVGNTPPEVVESMHQVTPAVIWCDTEVWEKNCCLRRREKQAGSLAAQALIEGGRRNLCWVGHPADEKALAHYSHAERLGGAEAAAKLAGIVMGSLGSYPWEDDAAALSRIEPLLTPGTGLVAYNTLLARWVLSAAGRLGKRPGIDFGIACCEDDEDLRLTWTGLTRCSFDRWTLGATAASMMLALLDGQVPVSRRIACELVPGSTAGPLCPRPDAKP